MPDLRGPEGQPAYMGIPTYIHAPFALTPEELKEMEADIAILGAPVDMGVVNRPGARFGPRAIRQAGYAGSPNDRFYHMGLGVYPTRILKVVDFGDANCPPSSLEMSHDAVRMKVLQALQAGALPIVLGGDHSITLPSATAVAHCGFPFCFDVNSLFAIRHTGAGGVWTGLRLTGQLGNAYRYMSALMSRRP